MIQVFIFDENGYFIETKLIKNNEITNNMTTVTPRNIGMIKLKWNGMEWIEGATREEINEWNENNKSTQKPTEQEIINSQLLKENAAQKLINSDLLKQIAELKGGTTNANV